MAARLRNDLGESVALEEGKVGEFTVLVDGAPVIKGGPWVLIGVLPPYGRVLPAVRAALERGANADGPGTSA